MRYRRAVAAAFGLGLVGGLVGLGGVAGKGSALAPFSAGLLLATGSSLLGFTLLQRHVRSSGSGFTALLMGLFLGRIALAALFGLALYTSAPAHLAMGLLSLAGFHFVLMLLEIVVLARSGRAPRDADARVLST